MPSISAPSVAALVEPPCRTEWLSQRPTGLQDLKYSQPGFLQKKFVEPCSRSLILEFAASQNLQGFFFQVHSLPGHPLLFGLRIPGVGRGPETLLFKYARPLPLPPGGSDDSGIWPGRRACQAPRLSSQDVPELDSESLQRQNLSCPELSAMWALQPHSWRVQPFPGHSSIHGSWWGPGPEPLLPQCSLCSETLGRP